MPLKTLTFYLDFVSPYAWLAFHALPRALQGLSYQVDYQPVLLGGLLQYHGQRAPVDVAPKRDWIYRHVQWLAEQQQLDFQMPSPHPFRSLALLRLALATDAQGLPNRYVCETLFRHVWQGGADAADPERLSELTRQLMPLRDPDDPVLKTELRTRTEDACARGVFGVPTVALDDQLFWGLDALPMLRAALERASHQDAPPA